jgi:NADH-quinone oxidoreductase subunit C
VAEEAATAESEAPDAAAPDTEAADSLRQPLLDALQSELGEDLVGYELAAGDDLCVRVNRSVWRQTVALCKERLGFSYFCFLSGLDWQPNPLLLGEKAWEAEEAVIEATEDAIDDDAADDDAAASDAAAADAAAADEAAAVLHEPPAAEGARAYPTGVAGGDTRFQVFARLYNVTSHVGITLKADLDEADPRIDSLVSLYRGADWHEREAWEMYGFVFDGHPRLRHLYLPGAFEGHPLRKDFPLLARLVKPWPGLVDVEPIPGDDAVEEESA